MSDADPFLNDLFGLRGKVAVVTGGTGVLGGAMADGLAAAGARVAILGRRREGAADVASRIRREGGDAMPLPADVLDHDGLVFAREEVLSRWGRIDILVNAAGGNITDATVGPNSTIFDVPTDALRQAIDLNFLGTVLPCQVFGHQMVAGEGGSIVNVSSMSVGSALTRIVGYSAGKAAMENFTRWLAVDLARQTNGRVRVNAVAPGFFVAEHNRELLQQADGSPTERGETILSRTPMGRFGQPGDLVSTVIWLCGTGSTFITGVVVPVDGGFSAFSGV